jgi:hypothetical protein
MGLALGLLCALLSRTVVVSVATARRGGIVAATKYFNSDDKETTRNTNLPFSSVSGNLATRNRFRSLLFGGHDRLRSLFVFRSASPRSLQWLGVEAKLEKTQRLGPYSGLVGTPNLRKPRRFSKRPSNGNFCETKVGCLRLGAGVRLLQKPQRLGTTTTRRA